MLSPPGAAGQMGHTSRELRMVPRHGGRQSPAPAGQGLPGTACCAQVPGGQQQGAGQGRLDGLDGRELPSGVRVQGSMGSLKTRLPVFTSDPTLHGSAVPWPACEAAHSLQPSCPALHGSQTHLRGHQQRERGFG